MTPPRYLTPADVPADRLADIAILFMDCDGVLTDGRVWVDGHGNETKAFSVIDGHGLVMLREDGVRLGLVSRDRSNIPRARAEKLGFEFIHNAIDDKATCVAAILKTEGVPRERAAFVGDDVPDLEAFSEVGLTIAPSSARPEVKQAADLVTTCAGGAGALRELCDAMLKARSNRL